MESQPQNPEFRINPENFHPCPYEHELSFLPMAYESQHGIYTQVNSNKIKTSSSK